MESNSVKWNNKQVYIHHITEGEYALVSLSIEKVKVFKLSFQELGMEESELRKYLLKKKV